MRIKSKVFFSRTLNDFVVDSLCKCGHLESEHGSKATRLKDGNLLREEGHGNCCKGKCPCPRFTWIRHVTVEERATQVIANRKVLKTA